MINANELRIGNYIATDSEEPEVLKIEGIKIYDKNSDESTVRLESFDKWVELNAVLPIPLTEEILLKCGFKRVSFFNTTISIKMEYENELLQMEWCDMWFGVSNDNYDSEIMVNIQYLHQLQNLYFALTGEELKIEL